MVTTAISSVRRARSSRKPKKPDAGLTVRQLVRSVGDQQWSNEKWAELMSDTQLDFDTLAMLAAIERETIRCADVALKTLSVEKLLALRQWVLNSDAEDGAVLSDLPSDHPESITRGIALKALAAAFKQRAPEIERTIQSLEHSGF